MIADLVLKGLPPEEDKTKALQFLKETKTEFERLVQEREGFQLRIALIDSLHIICPNGNDVSVWINGNEVRLTYDGMRGWFTLTPDDDGRRKIAELLLKRCQEKGA